ncbi:unnamed protein product [Rotaria sp. Silwood1]|nr:unnamed protein product [Rotaria sp. Silwood1]CAF1484302.1 unnamed protein product [Rotaria sp. Silwood1]CAF1682661.1 unnamed protein product [Rotaria sp. Silwood1]CAF1682666.1 unnamed protein product [Rotaria sp. Silwood1]CAF3794615.1 unnamed protein product [Rotaria sp. Silwood1]
MILPNECSCFVKEDSKFPLASKRILDIACGDGHYTRKLKDLGCSYILGIDISLSMIDIAKQKEAINPKSIDYLCIDGKQLLPPSIDSAYDIVTSSYYLNYAQTREELYDMVKVIYEQLKPNGSFYSMNDNVCGGLMDSYNNERHKKYTFMKELYSLTEGTPIKYTNYYDINTPSKSSFYNYYMPPVIYEETFNKCGFKSFEWVPIQCDPTVENPAFYDDLLKYPHIIGIIAKK